MRKSFIIIFITFIFVFVYAIIRRGDVIRIAQDYSSQEWVVVIANDKYSIYENSGDSIIGTAYSYGDKNTPSSFVSEINDSLIPRNWQENYNDSTRLLYTGIDCSGLVTRALYFSDNLILNTGASKLNKYAIKTSHPLPGDIYASTRHCFLQGEDSGFIYEANGEDAPDEGNRVQYYKKDPNSSYKKLTIFPIFEMGTESLTILTDSIDTLAFSGDISYSGDLQLFRLTCNGIQVMPEEIVKTKKKMHFEYKHTPMSYNKYRFICYAGNYINNTTYYDSIITDIYYLPDSSEGIFISDPIRERVPYGGYVFIDTTFTVEMKENDRFILAGDSLGIFSHWVDDIMNIEVLGESGFPSFWSHNYSEETGYVTDLAPTDLTDLFKEGINEVHITLQDDPNFKIDYGCSHIWLVKMFPRVEDALTEKIAYIPIDKSEFTGSLEVSVFDVSGRKIFKGTFNSITNMKSVFKNQVGRSGVFFYTATSDNGISSGKICIMR